MNEEKEVAFSIEKVGFHFIKVSRLLKRELEWDLEAILAGGYTEYMPLSRAQELKQKFETVGAKVSVKCGNCHAELADGATFCNKCGTKVRVSEFCKCPECGAVCAQDTKFCGKCGHELSVASETEKLVGEADDVEG